MDFPIRLVLDEDGNQIHRGDEDTRFLVGRAGDMYMVPFQCPRCHFRNLRGRDPSETRAADTELMSYISRAVLDSFWSRESSTVRGNLNALKMALESAKRFRLERALPPMGPFPLKDVFGMAQAIVMLDRSLAKGKYETHIQWNTTRKIASAMNNFGQASVDGLKEAVAAYENHKVWISELRGHTFFFSRFKEGMHRRVGELVKPDEPVTIEVLRKILILLEDEWIQEKSLHAPREKKLRELATSGTWFVVGFSAALRGEEMLLLDISTTRRSVKEMNSAAGGADDHFVLAISSPTKNNRVTGGRITIPIARDCPSGLRAGEWVTRYLSLDSRNTGPLFFRRFQKPKLVEFEDTFYGPIERAKLKWNDLLPDELSVREDFGILRSLRRGSNSHAINCGIDKEIIHAINRWRSALRGSGEGALIQDRYARLDAIRPTMLKYSSSL